MMATGNCLLVYLMLFTAITYEQSTMDSTDTTDSNTATTTINSVNTEINVKLLTENGNNDIGGTYSVAAEETSTSSKPLETTISETQSTITGDEAAGSMNPTETGTTTVENAKTDINQDSMTDTDTTKTQTIEATTNLISTPNEPVNTMSDLEHRDTTNRPTEGKSTQTTWNEDEMSTTKLMSVQTDSSTSDGLKAAIDASTTGSLEVTAPTAPSVSMIVATTQADLEITSKTQTQQQEMSNAISVTKEPSLATTSSTSTPTEPRIINMPNVIIPPELGPSIASSGPVLNSIGAMNNE